MVTSQVLSMNPMGPSATEAASDKLNTGGSTADQHVRGAGRPLKKAHT